MKLKVLDQVHVSSVQADQLVPGQEIDVDDALGAQLLKQNPTTFDRLGGGKAAGKPPNKAAPAHADKAALAPPAEAEGRLRRTLRRIRGE